MGALKQISLWAALILLAWWASDRMTVAAEGGHSLFTQSAAKTLAHDFTDPDISFLLLDAGSGEVLASRWDDAAVPIPMGSLVKPFTALAYGEQHGFAFPTFICHGRESGCWRPHGHGRMNLESAIAQSCNAYFAALASHVSSQQVVVTAARFNLESPQANAPPAAFVGIGRQWQISPLRLARAYLELLRRRDQPGAHEILAGMIFSARSGTGAAVDRALPNRGALAKTGTAPCTHAKRAPGDGFALVMWPVESPSDLLLVRVHGTTGANAAAVAGEMLHRIGE